MKILNNLKTDYSCYCYFYLFIWRKQAKIYFLVFLGQRQVAFSAALPTEATIGPANVLYPLVYRHVLYNVGGHYSPVTG